MAWMICSCSFKETYDFCSSLCEPAHAIRRAARDLIAAARPCKKMSFRTALAVRNLQSQLQISQLQIMKLAPQWIRDFVELPVDDRQLAENLTSIGIAVEGICGEGVN